MKNDLSSEVNSPRSGFYDLTRHAQKRCVERNLPAELIPLIFQHGQQGRPNKGCREWALDPKYFEPSSPYAPVAVAINDYGTEVVKTVYFVEWHLWLKQQL